MMIVDKSSPTVSIKITLNRARLVRKDMHKGLRVMLVTFGQDVMVPYRIMSWPYDETSKKSDKETGTKIKLRNDQTGKIEEHDLVELGVVPDQGGNWRGMKYLLNADRVKRKRTYGGDPDCDDPPER